MTRIMIGLGYSALLLASCGEQPASPDNPAKPIPNPFQDRLAQLDEKARNGAFRLALFDSGLPCDDVQRSNYRGAYKNMHAWSVHCVAPPGDFLLFIGPDSSVQIRQCSEAAQLDLPLCEGPAKPL